MKTHNYLRALIRETIMLEAEVDNITAGDVRQALKYAKGKNMKDVAAAVAKRTGMLGVKSLLSFFPGAGAIVDTIEAGADIKDLYDAAQSSKTTEKKSNPLWDILTIDPDTSTILDDKVEQDFINDISAEIETLPDNAKLPNADTQLNNYLKTMHNNTYITK